MSTTHDVKNNLHPLLLIPVNLRNTLIPNSNIYYFIWSNFMQTRHGEFMVLFISYEVANYLPLHRLIRQPSSTPLFPPISNLVSVAAAIEKQNTHLRYMRTVLFYWIQFMRHVRHGAERGGQLSHKHEIVSAFCFIAMPPSAMLAQHYYSIGLLQAPR